MAQTQTTSVRLPQKLRTQLEIASQNLHRGKNWIIIQALEEYLMKADQNKLAQEARRQSLLAAQHSENDIWEQNTDTSGWT